MAEYSFKQKENISETISEKIIKNVEGEDHHTIIRDLGEGKSIQLDYYKGKCVNVDYRNTKLENYVEELLNQISKNK